MSGLSITISAEGIETLCRDAVKRLPWCKRAMIKILGEEGMVQIATGVMTGAIPGYPGRDDTARREWGALVRVYLASRGTPMRSWRLFWR